VFGFWVTDAYMRIEGSAEARIDDVAGETGDRGHAVLTIAYDGDWFIVRDSRGESFGTNGSWYLHSSVVDLPWVSESWAIAALGYDD
jgi:hypothetical protein